MRARLTGVVIAALAVACVGAVSAAGAGARKVVHLRGTAYEFNNVHVMLAGATIHVAEYPQLTATVDRDGRYDLAVPDHARVTPYIVARGYHTIYLQTFTTDGEDLANVNFQTPTDAVYHALVLLLGVPIDANGNLVSCAIVSTFNTRNVRDLSFAQFIAYGAHGVAGATASAAPALPKPVYFNKNVAPDRTQPNSSEDGGVVWTNVPAGTYTITAHSPTTRFASFVASCRPGRVINANPPWGLHELGVANPARSVAAWGQQGAAAILSQWRISRLPAHPTITARCSGRGCRFRTRTYTPSGSSFDVGRALGAVTLRAGQTLDLSVTAHTFDGVLWRWTGTRRGVLKAASLCIPLGNTLPRARCP